MDDDRLRELEQRIDEIEQQLPDGITRRDALKLAGAGGIGALLGGGGAMTAVDQASAGTQSVGGFGTPGDPIDLDAVEDIYGPGGEGSGDAVNFEAVNTGEITLGGETRSSWPAGGSGGGLTAVRDASTFSGADGGEQIQAAIGDLPSSGGWVFVPAEGPDTNSRWTVSSHISVPSNVTVRGVPGATQLYLADSSNDDVFRVADSESSTPVEDATIEGFVINGNKANNGDVSDPDASDGSRYTGGVYVKRSTNLTVRDVVARNIHGYGVHIQGSTDALVENCIAENCADDGFSATDIHYSQRYTENVTFRNCESRDNANSGFEVDDGPRNVTHERCYASGNMWGFRTHAHSAHPPNGVATQNMTYRACTSENNQAGFHFGNADEGSPQDYNLIDCQTQGNSETGVSLWKPSGAVPVAMEDVTIIGGTYPDGIDLDYGNAGVSGITLFTPSGGTTITEGSNISDVNIVNPNHNGSLLGGGGGGGGTVTIVDDYESGSLDASYTGDTGNATVQTGTVFQGTYALAFPTDGNPYEMYSTSGLDAYPSQGDTFRVAMYCGSGSAKASFWFGTQDATNTYIMQLNPQDGELQMFRTENGSATSIALVETAPPQQTWLDVEIDWGTDITATVYDGGSVVDSLTATSETTFTSGGIGCKTSGSTQMDVFYDYARIV